MGWGKAQVSVKSLKIFDNKRGLTKLSNYYINKKLIKKFAIWYAMINKLGTKYSNFNKPDNSKIC